MKREQQIEKASIGRYPEWGEQQHALELAFQAGAIWADSHPHWISVEDELPPNNGGFSDEVQTYNLKTNQCVVAQFNYISNCWFGCDDTVTHWMPMPAPPSGSSEKPSTFKKLDMKGYENVIIHEGNAKGGILKDAQGDELPDYDREVVVLIQDYPDDEEHLRVAFGHRPKPNGYVTIDGEKIYPMTYGKGGWNGKNVRYWLDVKLPNQDEL